MSAPITLPYPPSTNRIWRSVRGRVVQSAEAREWKATAGWSARAAGWTLAVADVAVEIVLHPRLTLRGRPSARRVDLDNAIKATMDALNGIAYEDDRQVVRITASVGHALAGGGLTVAVEEITQ